MRKGWTIRANPEPFEDHYLNSLGRCIVTEHKLFVLFNIYAPVKKESLRVQFYEELIAAMRRYRRDTGKPVILTGDLNLTLTPHDNHYSLRKIHVPSLSLASIKTSDSEKGEISSKTQRLMQEAAQVWDEFLQALKQKTVVELTTFSKATQKEKLRYALNIPWKGRSVRVGQLWDKSENAQTQFDACEVNSEILVDDLKQILRTLFGKSYPKEAWVTLSDKYGMMLVEQSVHSCVTEMMKTDQMIDVHKYLYPALDYRYTCWNQHTNRRFENLGCRIDFFIMDKTLLEYVSETNYTTGQKQLLRCSCDPAKHTDFLSEEAGLCAVTAGGQFLPASFEGGGLQNRSKMLLALQFGDPHSGFIYTPPDFSDHIALSLLLDIADKDIEALRCVLDKSCSKTKTAQLFKKQTSIKSFFAQKKKRKLA